MSNILSNKRAKFDYALEDILTAGMVLEGWEVKALRSGRVSSQAFYAYIKDDEIFLTGLQISPLENIREKVDQNRTIKLLLKKKEIKKLAGKVTMKGYTLVPVDLFWQRGFAKVTIALGKGKTEYDKRHTEKKKDANREIERAMKVHKL